MINLKLGSEMLSVRYYYKYLPDILTLSLKLSNYLNNDSESLY